MTKKGPKKRSKQEPSLMLWIARISYVTFKKSLSPKIKPKVVLKPFGRGNKTPKPHQMH